MTEPLNYQTPVVSEKTQLLAWLSIALAVLSVVVDLFAIYALRNLVTSINVTTVNGVTYQSASMFRPAWFYVLQVLAIGAPLSGLIFAIMALRATNKAAAIAGIVLNAVLLAAVFLIA